MKNNKSTLITLALAIVLTSTSAMAASRSNKKIGLGLGFLSDPVPTLMSYQLKYNVTNWLQLGGGYGKVGVNVTSFGVNAKAFVIPSWNLSPYVGGGYTQAKVSGDFDFSGESITLGDKAGVIYASVGLDHQANMGFNIGGGVNFVFSPTELKEVLPMVPHFYFGWFF